MHMDELDGTNRTILSIIKDHARMGYTEIAAQIGISRVAVKKRMDHMEQCGIIKGYRTIIDEVFDPAEISFSLDMETEPERLWMEASNMSEQKTNIVEEIDKYLKNTTLETVMKEHNGQVKFVMYQNAELRSTDITALELSVRSYNCLKRKGYETVGQLVDDIYSTQDLKGIRNLGKKSADEIMMNLFLYQFSVLKAEKREAYIQGFMRLNGITIFS